MEDRTTHNKNSIDKGKADSEAVFGNASVLRMHLNTILASHENSIQNGDSLQKQEISSQKENLGNQVSSITSLNNLKTQKEALLPGLDEQSNQINLETPVKISAINKEIEELEYEINELTAELKAPITKKKFSHKPDGDSNKENSHEEIEQDLNSEIDSVKTEPETGLEKNSDSWTKTRSNRLSLYTCGIILASLTLLLILMYNTVSYSAFFRDPLTQLQQLQAQADAGEIVDPDAQIILTSIINFDGLSRIWSSSNISEVVSSTLLLLLFPAIPLALGYLGHIYKNARAKYFFYIFAFSYDCLLAYKLVKDINFAKATLSRQSIPEWDINTIISNVFSENFWLIIFSTFLVYFFWGILFDRFIIMLDETLPIKAEIDSKKKEIELLKEKKLKVKDEQEALVEDIKNRKNTVREEIQSINREIHDKEIKKAELENKIKTLELQLPINWSLFELEVNEYCIGWMQHISSHYKGNDRENSIKECIAKKDEFLNEVKELKKHYPVGNNNHK